MGVLKKVYDNGSLFDAKVLEITDDVLAAQFCEALGVLASISLAAGYPTQASVPHSIVNAFKAVLSVTIELDNYTFGLADQYEEYLKDPSKFSGPAGGGGGRGMVFSASLWGGNGIDMSWLDGMTGCGGECN